MPAFRALILAFVFVAAAGCSHRDASTTTTAADVTPAPGAIATSDGFASATPGPDAGTVTSPGPSVAPGVASATAAPAVATAALAVAAATPTVPPSSSLKGVALTDIAGTAGEAAIKNLAALGAIEPATGAFHPHGPLKRATFVRWLVKSNNIEQSGSNDQIRPAETAAASYFVDVSPSNPDYKYIQGMADAGFVVGIDAKHFAPSRNITREEMIAIYMNRLVGGKSYAATSVAETGDNFTDLNSISKPYWGAFHDDNYTFGPFRSNVARAFGAGRTLHPQRPATREEAAILVSQIQYGSAAKSVQAAAAPSR